MMHSPKFWSDLQKLINCKKTKRMKFTLVNVKSLNLDITLNNYNISFVK